MSKQRKRLGRVPRSAPTDFVSELTIFHEEQAIAQRCFFGYLAIRDKAAKDNELLGVINLNPWFWTTVYYSLLLATIASYWLRSWRWGASLIKIVHTMSTSLCLQ
jgi:hypothetical protein